MPPPHPSCLCQQVSSTCSPSSTVSPHGAAEMADFWVPLLCLVLLFYATICRKAMPDCTGSLPGISGGLQSLLLDPSTLSSLYGAMGTSSGAFLALSQLPGINMDAVQVTTSHVTPSLTAAAYETL